MKNKKTNFCMFTGDGKHDWDEMGYKEKCDQYGGDICVLYKQPIVENNEGWPMCCDECKRPIQVKNNEN